MAHAARLGESIRARAIVQTRLTARIGALDAAVFQIRIDVARARCAHTVGAVRLQITRGRANA